MPSRSRAEYRLVNRYGGLDYGHSLDFAMEQSAREAKRARVERLRDAALRLSHADRSPGSIEIGGERKRVMEWRYNELFVQAIVPHPAAPSPSYEPSSLRIVEGSRTVLNVRWDYYGELLTASFKPGEWEASLIRRDQNGRLSNSSHRVQ